MSGVIGIREDRGGDKNNILPPGHAATWYQSISVELGNHRPDRPGDNVGMVTPWAWPDPNANLPANRVQLARDALAGGKWRQSDQSPNWAGIPIGAALGLDIGIKSDRAKVKDLIQLWTRQGAFEVYEAVDEVSKRNKTYLRSKSLREISVTTVTPP